MTKAPIKKITMRNIGMEMNAGESAVIIGKFQRARDGHGDNGDFTRFNGHFEAVNEQTGKVFTAAEIILPMIAELAVTSALQSVQERNRLGSVELALRVRTVENAEAILGYSWEFEYVAEPTGITNPLARLRAALVKGDCLKGKAALLIAPAEEKAKGDVNKK